MVEEVGAQGYEPMSLFGEENLFKLQCIIKASEIQQSAQCEYGKKLFLAFTTGNSEIILYFKQEPAFTPIIKRIPWFQGLHKQISALCFHPLGTWLLCASLDGSLHIIPALSVVKESSLKHTRCMTDTRWNTEDVTSFPPMNSQSSHSKPTAIVWWQDVGTPADVAIIGTEYGEIVFTNLKTGHQMALTHINAHIVTLHICRDKSSESTLLLITSDTNQQWRLFLERYNYSCLSQSQNDDSYNAMQSSESIYDNGKSFASTRSRLQGLKQLSVEKLAILRQKLTESRNQCSGDSSRYDVANNRNASNTSINSDSNSETSQTCLTPEPIAHDAFLMSQSDREGQQLYTCYHANSNHITVHGPDSSAVPLSVHKVFSSCKNILLTERFFFVTDENQRSLYVISDRLSESRTNENCKFNPECIIGRFSLENSQETIRAVYRTMDYTNEVPKSLSQDIETKYTLPKNIAEVKVELPPVDTCLIVTNYSVYKIVLRKSLVTIFMDIVLRRSEIEKAMQFASVFGMNAHQLLEQAGDILLCNKEFSRAVICYKLSKCKMLKNVLKFSLIGYIAELLSCLIHWLVLPAISELPVATRIHLSNLCVLAFIEMTLRISPQKSKAVYKEFLYFLSTNTFYDELLAVNVSGQTCLWEVLHHLATQRGLYGQMLDVLMKTVHSFSSSSHYLSPYGLLICVSEPCLMQVMLINSNLGRSHMSFVLDSLQESQIFVLQRLVALYDPTNPVIRPRIVRSRARHRTTSHSSQSSQCDSIDLGDDEGDSLIEEMIETFLLILITLIYKKCMLRQEYPLACNKELLEIQKDYHIAPPIVDFKRRQLSSGFSHVILIRNGNVYTWGSSVQGCLGTGPSVLRYGTPQPITFFRTMQVDVLSVSCGHCHTLAVTNNGIYAWGSSQFGQLGLGKMLRCSSPELITSLAQEIITDCVAGQYHSVALTADGRIFTWGWGVHGQLGHGNTAQKNIPTLVSSLLGVVIRYIAAGHAHTLALSTEGVVYAFGCNVFGQLGVGTNVKSSLPMKVLLSDKIILIATSYFHNLAVSNTNKLFVWGASPHVLRLQAQAQKKSRILEHQQALERQEAFERQQQASEELEKRIENKNVNDMNGDICLEHNEKANKNAQIKSNLNEARRKVLDHATLKNINVGMLEEAQTHLKPTIVDTSFVKGDIIQITTGCHHNALVTKDGSLYTWGRNLDGQIGNGTKREVTVPMPLLYNAASIFTQIPPRHKKVEEEQGFDAVVKNSMNERNGNISIESKPMQRDELEFKETSNPVIKTVGVSCGYDFTVAIQPGGTILAWGNNSKAQLGRLPAKDLRDDKLVLLKSAKRVVRLPHVALDVPSQVPNIPTPIISYQSYDVPSYAGLIRPLSVIEKSPGELTLHYALEYFSGLYDSSRIMEKCIQLGNYQACSKIAMLQHNIVDAISYQLKVLNAINLRLASSRTTLDNAKLDSKQNRISKESPVHIYKRNTELFNKQVEKNLMESAEDCVARNKMKIPASKSLNSLQTIQDEFYTFDCQGGSEELCKDVRCNQPLDISEDALDSDLSSDSEEWIENIMADGSRDNSTASTPVERMPAVAINTMENKNVIPKESPRNLNTHKIRLMNETIKVIKFYFIEMEHEPDTIKYKILQDILDFWTEHNLPIENLENVFRDHIDIVFYPLGLLLFCQEIMEKYLDANRNNPEIKNSGFTNLFSFKFCIEVCALLLDHIDQDQPAPEYIKLLSSLAADHYGPPLTGYPGTSGNNTSKQMMEGVISTISSDKHNSRSFVHIKDPGAVYRFLETEENTMVFTCGHHFPQSIYEAEIIPTMETELLTSESVVLPCTAQFLGKTLSQNRTPEILCPQCVPRALETLVKKSNE